MSPSTAQDIWWGLRGRVRPRARLQQLAHDVRDPTARDRRAWALLRSRRAEEELDAANVVCRTDFPYQPGYVLPADQDLTHFDRAASFRQEETAGYTSRPCFVDPLRGWVIARPFHLVHRGVTFNYRVLPPPDFAAFCKSRLRKEPTLKVPEAISLRFPDEDNYFHFQYHLVGGRLRLAEECEVPQDVPILVGERLYEKPFFKDFWRLTGLQDRTVVVQDHRLVECERLFLAQPFEHARQNLAYLHRCLSLPDSDPQARRRIFAARKGTTGRNISNMSDMADLCRRFGFELVEQEGMSFEETIELFSQARFVVGIFGAGLGSIAYRKNAPLSLLEIYPPAYTGPRLWYLFIASALGFKHYYYGASFGNPELGIPGNTPPPAAPLLKPHLDRSSFTIDPENLSKVLAKMLEEE